MPPTRLGGLNGGDVIQKERPLLNLKKWRLVAQRDHESQHTRGSGNQRIMSIFDPREVGRPGSRITTGDTVESCLQILVGPLRLTLDCG